MSTEELLLLAGGGAVAYYFLSNRKEGRAGESGYDMNEMSKAHMVQDIQHRHLLVGLATGKGHTGANRYVQTGDFMYLVPNQDMEHFASIRGVAAAQYHENIGAGEFMRLS